MRGKKKGYWKHPHFRHDSSFEGLKSVVSAKRLKNVSKRSNLSATCNAVVKHKGQIKKKGVNAPVALKPESSIAIGILPTFTVSNESKQRNCEEYTSQPGDSYANIFYSGDRRKGVLTEESSNTEVMKDNTSSTEIDSSRIEDQFLSDPIPDCNYDIPAFFDDSSHDALTALATVASFLPIAPMPLYTPILKSFEVIQPVPIKQVAPSLNAASPLDVKMTILADTARWFFPTPIKLPNVTDCIHCFTLNDSAGCCCDDAISSYSVGSLSSPMKFVLPFCDRSAFATPLVSSTDQMVAEFCESFH